MARIFLLWGLVLLYAIYINASSPCPDQYNCIHENDCKTKGVKASDPYTCDYNKGHVCCKAHGPNTHGPNSHDLPLGPSHQGPPHNSHGPHGPPHHGPPHNLPHGPPHHGPPHFDTFDHGRPHGPPHGPPPHGPPHGPPPHGPPYKYDPRREKYGYGKPGYSLDFYENDHAIHGGLSYQAKEILRDYRYRDECGVRHESPADMARVSTGYGADLGLTSFGEFPWHVALLVGERRRRRPSRVKYEEHRLAYRFHCGATLVHPVLVITAAHCVKGFKVRRLKLHLGDWNLRNSAGELFPAVERKVERVFIHSGYNPSTYLHDIAILEMDWPVEVSRTPHIGPACLPKDNYRFEKEKKCIIVGWGDDVYKPRFGSNLLKATEVTYVSGKTCASRLYATLPKVSREFTIDEDLQKCIVGDYGRDACVGDGGGAVVCPISTSEAPEACNSRNCRPEHYFVAGVISFGSPVCGENSTTVVTNIIEHVNWIHTILDPAGGIKSYDRGYYEDYRGRSAPTSENSDVDADSIVLKPDSTPDSNPSSQNTDSADISNEIPIL